MPSVTSLNLKWNQYIQIKPTPKQTAFLLLNAQEAMYGGSGGGGKSTALLMAALQYVDVSGYAALIIRRTYADLALPGGLIETSREWLSPTDARWNEQRKTWTFPSGATLTFGYLEHESDKYRYAGSEFQFIGLDEVTQISQLSYKFMFSRLRKKKALDIPLRMRCASNPGGPGHNWVRDRFITSKQFGRIFVPAKLNDNPHLHKESYLKSLSQVDPITRARILEGDWTVTDSGGLFRREWFEVVDALPAESMAFVRFWDLAATEAKPGTDPDYTVGLLLAFREGIYYVVDVRRTRATPKNVEKLIRQTAELDGKEISIWMEEQPAAAGKMLNDYYARTILSGFAIRFFKPTGDKVTRANPVSAQAEAGNIKIMRGSWNAEFLDEVEAFPQGSHDDQVDSLSGAFTAISGNRDSIAWRKAFLENAETIQKQLQHGPPIRTIDRHPVFSGPDGRDLNIRGGSRMQNFRKHFGT